MVRLRSRREMVGSTAFSPPCHLLVRTRFLLEETTERSFLLGKEVELKMGSFSHDPWYISWEAMNARAWWYLNHSSEILPSISRGRPFHGIPRLRYWDDAGSFECEADPTTLTLFELIADDYDREPVVREAVWRRSTDLRRLHKAVGQSRKVTTFKPTIAVRDGTVPAEQLSSLLWKASTYQVPVVWPDQKNAVSTDVGAVGFEFFSRDQPPAVLRFQWSLDKPAVWEPIAEWSGQLRQFLESCLSAVAEDYDEGTSSGGEVPVME
jgi:hypothetical protein